MNQDIMNLFNSESPIESFFKVMMAPDDTFDKYYEQLLFAAKDAVNSKQVQTNILNNLSGIPVIDENSELSELKQMINEIEEDKELSENKKNVLRTFIQGIGELTIELRKNPRERVNVNIYRINDDARIPTYANPSDAGADIYATDTITLPAHSTTLVSTGLKVDIPAGYALFIYPRSGLSLKTKLRIANSVGIIDHLYHEEIKIIVDNTGDTDYVLSKGDRIAQMIIMPVPMINFLETKTEFEDNGRSGFGSTGQ